MALKQRTCTHCGSPLSDAQHLCTVCWMPTDPETQSGANASSSPRAIPPPAEKPVEAPAIPIFVPPPTADAPSMPSAVPAAPSSDVRRLLSTAARSVAGTACLFVDTLRRVVSSTWRFARTLMHRPLSSESREAVRFAALLALLTGLALIWVAGQQIALRFFATDTVGTVRRNSVETLQTVKGSTTYTYVRRRYVDFEFTTSNGERFIGNCSLTENSPGPAVGTSVPVRYLASAPDFNYLVGVNPPPLWAFLRTLLGLLLYALAFWLFLVALRAPIKALPPAPPGT